MPSSWSPARSIANGPDPVALAPLFAVSDLAMGFRLVNLAIAGTAG